jgi:hypothetical protein
MLGATCSFGRIGMRLNSDGIVTDHGLLTGVDEDDHHNRGESATVLVNPTPISPGAYEVRVALSKTGFRTFRALLRGSGNVDIQGHVGVFVIAGGVSGECSGIGIAPYGASGYVTSYMGAYSRIHGDSYLSPSGTFGDSIALRDAYIDGDEAVLEFYNASGLTKSLTVYGTLAVK